MAMIEVIPYDSDWNVKFNTESKRIKKLLGRNCVAVHHIGSTAVEEMSARPVIDVLVVVKDAEKLQPLLQDGYTVDPLQSGALSKGNDYRVYICTAEQTERIQSALALVEYLRGNEKRREEYSQLKSYLAQACPDDVAAYEEGKAYYMAQLEQEALTSVPDQKEEAEEQPRSLPRSLAMAIGLLMGYFIFDNIGVGLCMGLTGAFLISKLKEK